MAVGFCALASLDNTWELGCGFFACIVGTDKTEVHRKSFFEFWCVLKFETRWYQTRLSEWAYSPDWTIYKGGGARITYLANASRDWTGGGCGEEVACGCVWDGFPASVVLD